MNSLPPSGPVEQRPAVPRAVRPAWSILAERFWEVLIYLCGISAIIFVAGIFFFVFKEAIPMLGRKDFSLSQFLFSEQWYPTSEVHKRYGVLAMIVGTFSVTGLAMPPLLRTWRLYDSSNSRLTGGLLLPEPNYIFCEMGSNDSSISSASFITT